MKTVTRTVRVVDQDALYVEVGRRLRQAREKAGLSQQRVGMVLGCTRANVANLEAGKTRILLEHVYNAAILLKCRVSELLP